MSAVTYVESARKPWQCDMCGATIAVGQPYTRIRRYGRPVVVLHRPESLCQKSAVQEESK